jgi:diacylglycerol kinase
MHGSEIWVLVACSLVVLMLIVLIFNFTLTFLEALHENNKRLAKQNKNAATFCVFLTLFIPIIYSLYMLLKF